MKALKNILLLFTFYFSANISFGQLENATWCFGSGARVNFIPPPLTAATSNNSFQYSRDCASVSNASGQLLFYSDGFNIFNANDQIISNGTGLYGYSDGEMQNMAIVPKPGHPGIYYFFSIGSIEILPSGSPVGRGGIHYSVIDMTPGNEHVVTGLKNIPVSNQNGIIDYTFDYAHTEDNPQFVSCKSRITTTTNATGDKIWVSMIPEFYYQGQYTRYFYNFLVSSDGINGYTDGTSPHPNVETLLNGPNYSVSNPYTIASMKISPNGHLLCDAEDRVVNLYDYDNATGAISFNRTVYSFVWDNAHSVGYGLEFSPNSQLIYFTDNPFSIIQSGLSNSVQHASQFGSIYQYSIAKQKLSLIYNYSPSNIITPLPATTAWGIQLGIDNKIYACTGQYQDYLGIIQYPDVPGTGCGFVANGFQLTPNTYTSNGLPQWVHKAEVCTAPQILSSSFFDPDCNNPHLPIIPNSFNYYCIPWECAGYSNLESEFATNNQWYVNDILIPSNGGLIPGVGYVWISNNSKNLLHTISPNNPQLIKFQLKNNSLGCELLSQPTYVYYGETFFTNEANDLGFYKRDYTRSISTPFNYVVGSGATYTWSIPGTTVTDPDNTTPDATVYFPPNVSLPTVTGTLTVTNSPYCNGVYQILFNYNPNLKPNNNLTFKNPKNNITNTFTTSIYPNPASSELTISSNNACIQFIEIIDFFGTTIKRITVKALKEVYNNVGDLHVGIYNCKITTDKGIEYKKLIIKRN